MSNEHPAWAMPGKMVCVVGHEDEGGRTVSRLMGSAYPGGVVLAAPVDGLRYWNVDELKPWEAP